MVNNLVIIGPAWPFRGSLAAFDEKIATTFLEKGIPARIETFSLQYPNFLFPGKTQFRVEKKPTNIIIDISINSINPFNWIKVGLQLRKAKPSLIIVRYWLPFLAPCLGTICRIARSNQITKVIAIVDNMIPHEKRIGDTAFTKYFAASVDGFLTMSEKVKKDVQLFSSKPIIISPHPIFDYFGSTISKEEARNQLNIPNEQNLILFFGFIRKYKGLDILLNAMASEKMISKNIHLMIVGEFYEDAKPYHELVQTLGIQDRVQIIEAFIPDNEVKKYVCSADFIIQPYRNATQSGVTPLAYHFEKPMLVTNVGGLADTVPDNKVGVVVEPNAKAIATGIESLYEKGEAYYIPFIKEEKKKFTWEQMVNNFLLLHQQIQ
jgi:glycosyltransferase involved in cell wall biosynthesis